MGKTLGDPADPLLVSVRSGAAASMPGMMETVLNVGLNDESVQGLAAAGRQRAVRLGLLPPADPDVRQDRPRHRRRAVRARPRRGQARAGHRPRPRSGRRAPRGRRRPVQGHREGADRRASSRWTRASRWTWPSTPSSTRGTPTGRSSTAAASASRATPAPRSTSARWCSATSGRTPAPASRSPATRAAARRASTATTCRTRRARTSSPASATPCRWPTSRTSTRAPTTSSWTTMSTLESHYRDLCDIEFTIERNKLWMLQTRVGQADGGAPPSSSPPSWSTRASSTWTRPSAG